METKDLLNKWWWVTDCSLRQEHIKTKLGEEEYSYYTQLNYYPLYCLTKNRTFQQRFRLFLKRRSYCKKLI